MNIINQNKYNKQPMDCDAQLAEMQTGREIVHSKSVNFKTYKQTLVQL